MIYDYNYSSYVFLYNFSLNFHKFYVLLLLATLNLKLNCYEDHRPNDEFDYLLLHIFAYNTNKQLYENLYEETYNV